MRCFTSLRTFPGALGELDLGDEPLLLLLKSLVLMVLLPRFGPNLNTAELACLLVFVFTDDVLLLVPSRSSLPLLLLSSLLLLSKSMVEAA